MILKDGYVVMYSDYSTIQPLWVRKNADGTYTELPVISTDDNDTYVDLSDKTQFKVIHCDGKHLTVRKADGTDMNIVLRAGVPTGDVILGEKLQQTEMVHAKVARKTKKVEESVSEETKA